MVPRGAKAAAMSAPSGQRATFAADLVLCLSLAGCAMGPPVEGPEVWAGRPLGAPPAPDPALRQAVIARAVDEWEFFGRQTVLLRGGEESIPHVGAWEDEDGPRSARINAYWRTVDRPLLTGMDCQAPWSAAFIGWVMQEAGVPEIQFPPAAAHGVYLARLVAESEYPGRYFVPRRIADHSPSPGDLVCASRGTLPAPGEDAGPEALRSAQTHCDLVVAKAGRSLEVIGGNVRNSVSRTILELDASGRLQPEPRRAWFVILQNRL